MRARLEDRRDMEEVPAVDVVAAEMVRAAANAEEEEDDVQVDKGVEVVALDDEVEVLGVAAVTVARGRRVGMEGNGTAYP